MYFSVLMYSNPVKFVLVPKVRIPVGRIILELPAGMLDDDKGDFLGTAIREVSPPFSQI